MAYEEDDFEELDNEELEEDDEETLEELDVDENGHVIERRKRRRNRDDEYEPDFDDEERHPAAYGYEGPEDSYD